MLVHYFQIILNFLYVCQSVCLLTSLLKLEKYRDISSSEYLSDFFWRYSWDDETLATNVSGFHVCLSVCLFVYFLTEIRQRDISSSEWDIFLEFFGDLPEVLVHWIKIIQISLYVCQSGSWHTSLMKYDKFRDIASSGWDIFLNFYGHIPGMLVHLFQIILEF